MADRSVIVRAADIIEPHIIGDFKRRQRAEGNARDLADAGLLGAGTRDKAVNVLQCRHHWRVAEKMADDLDAAGLLRGDDGA